MYVFLNSRDIGVAGVEEVYKAIKDCDRGPVRISKAGLGLRMMGKCKISFFNENLKKIFRLKRALVMVVLPILFRCCLVLILLLVG